MIIAYHAIFTTYGTWLPNDPRGSFSKEIYSPYLRDLGEIRYGRQDPQPDRETLVRYWRAAGKRLSRPPFFFDDRTRPTVASGFAEVVQRLALHVPACSIMNDHVHVLVLKSRYRIEYLVNQLKGAATHALELSETPWARKSWEIFIDDIETLRAAVRYIEDNPPRSGLPPRRWSFVRPLPKRYS